LRSNPAAAGIIPPAVRILAVAAGIIPLKDGGLVNALR
jgi:hypothetical protein